MFVLTDLHSGRVTNLPMHISIYLCSLNYKTLDTENPGPGGQTDSNTAWARPLDSPDGNVFSKEHVAYIVVMFCGKLWV